MLRGVKTIKPCSRKPAPPDGTVIIVQKAKGEDVLVALERRAAGPQGSRIAERSYTDGRLLSSHLKQRRRGRAMYEIVPVRSIAHRVRSHVY
jgi:hypothetical protein